MRFFGINAGQHIEVEIVDFQCQIVVLREIHRKTGRLSLFICRRAGKTAAVVGAHAPLQNERQDVTRILPLDSQNEDAIEGLLDAAFGTDRRGRTAYLIRKGMHWLPDLSYAALDADGDLVGTLQSWPVALHEAGQPKPLVMVGPVAVRPNLQNGGYGRASWTRRTRCA